MRYIALLDSCYSSSFGPPAIVPRVLRLVNGNGTAATGYGISGLSSVSVEVKDAVQYVYATTVNTDTNSYATFTFRYLHENRFRRSRLV
jgi:hypothetical protein